MVWTWTWPAASTRSAGDSRPTGGRGANRASRTIWSTCLTRADPHCGPNWRPWSASCATRRRRSRAPKPALPRLPSPRRHRSFHDRRGADHRPGTPPTVLLSGGAPRSTRRPPYRAGERQPPIVPTISPPPRCSGKIAWRGSPTPPDQSEPTRIRYFGDYEIIREIARGGMGVVFQARQVSLNRPVALKMILAGQLADETDVKRFYTEAEAAANLDHPGIVPIFEVGQHEGQHYFSMGFVEGQSLSQRLADGPLPAREAAELIRRGQRGHRVCPPARRDSPRPEAGQYPARPERQPAGHRLRPGQEGAGRQRADRLGPDHGDAQLHAAGAGRRQAGRGRPGGRRVCAWGRRSTPWSPAGRRSRRPRRWTPCIQVISDEPVPPRRLNASIPRDLETICLKCLEKEPAKRYASAAALAEDLRRYLAGEPILARPVTRVERAVKWARRQAGDRRAAGAGRPGDGARARGCALAMARGGAAARRRTRTGRVKPRPNWPSDAEDAVKAQARKGADRAGRATSVRRPNESRPAVLGGL